MDLMYFLNNTTLIGNKYKLNVDHKHQINYSENLCINAVMYHQIINNIFLPWFIKISS